MTENMKYEVINWLEVNRNNGFFEGYLEDDMDFNELSNEDLEWYYNNWLLPDRENS